MRQAVIFDMDGTLCDVSTVRHHVRSSPRDFNAFHSGALSCPPHADVAAAARLTHLEGTAVVVVTARDERWRRQTNVWLAIHDIPSDHLFMRAAKDGRSDLDVKRDILARVRQRYEVVRAWDDNPSIIELWRSEGIAVRVVDGWEDE